jgi:hypothetical protein
MAAAKLELAASARPPASAHPAAGAILPAARHAPSTVGERYLGPQAQQARVRHDVLAS